MLYKLPKKFDILQIQRWAHKVIAQVPPMGGSHSPWANVDEYLEEGSVLKTWSLLTIQKDCKWSQEPFLRYPVSGVSSKQYTQKTEIFDQCLEPILETFPSAFRMAMVGLEGNSGFQWHIDPPKCNVRFTLPVFTNPESYFFIEDQKVHFPADGHVWMIDTNKRHRAVNQGNDFRLHIHWEMHSEDIPKWL